MEDYNANLIKKCTIIMRVIIRGNLRYTYRMGNISCQCAFGGIFSPISMRSILLTTPQAIFFYYLRIAIIYKVS